MNATQVPRQSALLQLLIPVAACLTSLLAGGFVLGYVTAVFEMRQVFTEGSGWLVTLALASTSFATLLCGGLAGAASCTLLTLLLRGPAALAWVRPGQVKHFGHWLMGGWNFFAKGGRQRGMRVLGVEVAFEGRL